MTDDMTPPDWFVDEFRSAFIDLSRDNDDGGDDGDTVRRARQLWFAVVAHHAAQPSTVVDAAGGIAASAETVPRLGLPEPATPNEPNSRRVYAMVPGRDADGNAAMQPLYVTRDAEVRRAPRVNCPTCGGEGGMTVYEGDGPVGGVDRMCDTCMGTGTVVAPPTPARETGIVPDDHPYMAPPSAADVAAREALPSDPNTAAAVAAVRARTAAMRDR